MLFENFMFDLSACTVALAQVLYYDLHYLFKWKRVEPKNLRKTNSPFYRVLKFFVF